MVLLSWTISSLFLWLWSWFSWWKVVEVLNHDGRFISFSLQFYQFLPHVLLYSVVRHINTKDGYIFLEDWPVYYCVTPLYLWQFSEVFIKIWIFFHSFLCEDLFISCLAVLGLHCYAQAFSSCSKQGLLFVVLCELLIVVVSLAVEHGL